MSEFNQEKIDNYNRGSQHGITIAPHIIDMQFEESRNPEVMAALHKCYVSLTSRGLQCM